MAENMYKGGKHCKMTHKKLPISTRLSKTLLSIRLRGIPVRPMEELEPLEGGWQVALC